MKGRPEQSLGGPQAAEVRAAHFPTLFPLEENAAVDQEHGEEARVVLVLSAEPGGDPLEGFPTDAPGGDPARRVPLEVPEKSQQVANQRVEAFVRLGGLNDAFGLPCRTPSWGRCLGRRCHRTHFHLPSLRGRLCLAGRLGCLGQPGHRGSVGRAPTCGLRSAGGGFAVAHGRVSSVMDSEGSQVRISYW